MQEIKEQFRKVLSYSQGTNIPKINKTFEEWASNKARFIAKFGGLIYEFPDKVCFHLDEEKKESRIQEFASTIRQTWNNDALADFIEQQKDGFFDNLTIADTTGSDGAIIKKGTKLVRSFKHFDNSTNLKNIQNQASQIIQEDKIEGKLCFSVHPLDFLSVSENTYKWKTCHSLDGDFRSGNLSYMTDNVTFICYVKGADDVMLPNFDPDVKWNSKKWRVLLYYSPVEDCIYAGRQYPFSSIEAMDYVMKILPLVGICRDDVSSGRSWTGWQEAMPGSLPLRNTENRILKLDDANYIYFNGGMVPISKAIHQGENATNYNDVIRSDLYKPLYSFIYRKDKYFDFKEIYSPFRSELTIGGPSYCIECGNNITLEGSGTMRCEACELAYGTEVNETFDFCSCCGKRGYVDDMYWIGSDLLCETCYYDNTHTCANCNHDFYFNELQYDEENDCYLCYECYREEINNG